MSDSKNWLKKFFKQNTKKILEETKIQEHISESTEICKEIYVDISYNYSFQKSGRKLSLPLSKKEKRVAFKVPKDFKIWHPKDKNFLENKIYDYVLENLAKKHNVKKNKIYVSGLHWF